MNELFGRPLSEVDNNFMAKVLLAYNTMHRAAKNSQEFKRTVNIFAKPLCKKTRENILAAYIALYEETPHWESKTSRQRKKRPAKKPKSSDPRDGQLALDLADLRGPADKLD